VDSEDSRTNKLRSLVSIVVDSHYGVLGSLRSSRYSAGQNGEMGYSLSLPDEPLLIGTKQMDGCAGFRIVYQVAHGH
jgi:hypothetical protein